MEIKFKSNLIKKIQTILIIIDDDGPGISNKGV